MPLNLTSSFFSKLNECALKTSDHHFIQLKFASGNSNLTAQISHR